MNKMMKIFQAGLVAFVLAFVMAPMTLQAGVLSDIVGGNNGYAPGYTNSAGHTVAPAPSGGQGAASSSSSTVQAGEMSGAGGFRSLGSGENAKDIFVILQKKIYGTLVDLRQIVYVIAGFGLVVFAVAAIFNKISYKHLGYIMIGLSLLSLMFPFLEYFSGYNVETANQKQLTFKDYLAASNYATIRGTLDSDITNPTGEGQPPMTEEEFERMKEENKAKYGGLLTGVDTSALTTGVTGPKTETKLAGQEQRDEIIKAGCNPVTMKGGWNPETMARTVCSVGGDGTILTKIETCNGKLKNGVCTKTAGQILSDVVNTVHDTTQIGLGIAGAIASGGGAIIDTVAGAQGIDAIWNSDMSFFDKINAISNLTANTWGSSGAVTHDLAMVLGGLISASKNAGDIGSTWSSNPENNTKGENPFTALMELLGGYGTNAQSAIAKGGSYVSTGTHYGNDLHDEAHNVSVILSMFGKGSTLSERWKSVFGKK